LSEQRSTIETRTPPEMCVRCHYVFDATTGIPGNERATPKEGDLSICVNCGHASVFAADLRKRPLTEKERLDLSREERLILRMAKRFCSIAMGENLATRGSGARH